MYLHILQSKSKQLLDPVIICKYFPFVEYFNCCPTFFNVTYKAVDKTLIKPTT